MNKAFLSAAAFAACISVGPASAEILAMMSYETKPAEDLKSLKLSGDNERREGIAIIDVDPKSPSFGKWLADIPLDPSGVAHHLFYDRDMKKAYLTSLGKPSLQVMDMATFPPRLRVIDIPKCDMAEDVIFDDNNEYWYLTCMSSGNVWRGRVLDDTLAGEIKLPGTNPHGLAVDTDIDRILVTSTIKGDLTGPGETLSIVKASTLEPLGTVKLSDKPSPSGVAPVEIVRAPGDGPPVFMVTNMFGASIWAVTWNPATKDFDAAMSFDYAPLGAGVPLEVYFNEAGDRMYATTAVPGQMHIFDVSGGVMAPKLMKTIPTGGGAHHVAFTTDGRYGFVQNSFINLPDMRDGSVTVVDLEKGEAIASVDTLKNAGLNPNVIVLLPQWNDLAGH
ncbi:MAG: DNA-binding beta-propeller fold protein YncE [Paracoccaceae bacterium]|jgi:DNA-binding beta-propeller fold protein YncE